MCVRFLFAIFFGVNHAGNWDLSFLKRSFVWWNLTNCFFGNGFELFDKFLWMEMPWQLQFVIRSSYPEWQKSYVDVMAIWCCLYSVINTLARLQCGERQHQGTLTASCAVWKSCKCIYNIIEATSDRHYINIRFLSLRHFIHYEKIQ